MDESNRGAVILHKASRQAVEKLDFILDHLMRAAPSVAAEREVPFTIQEVRAIKSIGARGSITMSALASELGVSLPTATHIVDRLVAKGAALRTRPEHDRRLVLVALSERAKEHEKSFFENRVAYLYRILESLGQAERERAVQSLGEIAQAIESDPAGEPERPQIPHENIPSGA
jgi:MarR family transcriptional regulator, organic hydroperoxide resistance regulator